VHLPTSTRETQLIIVISNKAADLVTGAPKPKNPVCVTAHVYISTYTPLALEPPWNIKMSQLRRLRVGSL